MRQNSSRLKIAVTGANGYIGSHVVKFLLDNGYNVLAFDLRNDNIDPRASFYALNFLSKAKEASLYAEMQSPDVLIHMAWRDGFNHDSDAHLDDLSAHYAFLKNMIDSGCSSISVMGTMHEVGYWEGCVDENTPCAPLSLYGVAKNALRQSTLLYAKSKPVSVKWLRAFYITGDDTRNKSVFSAILRLANEGKETFPFTDGKNQYDFLDIDELSRQIALATLQTEINGIINVCSGKPVSLKDKVEEFISKKSLSIRPEYGAFPTRPYDSPACWGSTDRIHKILKRLDQR